MVESHTGMAEDGWYFIFADLPKLNELKTLDSQPHENNLDAILDERDRRVESRLLSILETM